MRILVPFLALAACVAAPVAPDNVLIDMGQIETATDGRCFANDVASAVIETVTIQEVDQPELRDADGTITRPASFRTITRQQIVRERTDIRFETICPQNYTAEFVTTLQWALKRGASMPAQSMEPWMPKPVPRSKNSSGALAPIHSFWRMKQRGPLGLSRYPAPS